MFDSPATTLAIAGSTERFAVHRIYCVGRNYADHAREMGADPDREPPFFFMKPADAAVAASGVVPYPPQTAALHHEVELVVALGAGGADVPVASALDLVWGYGVGLDLTRRDLQDRAKELRRPWDLAKGFDASAPMSLLHPAAVIGHPSSGAITLSVDGAERQRGDLADQIWSVPELIAELSRFVRLEPGDLIMTGTPAGVGALLPGERVTAAIAGVGDLDLEIGPAPGSRDV